MGRRRNGARVQGVLKSFLRMVCGFRLAGSRYDGRRSRAFARLAFTGRAKQGPSARRSTPHHRPQGAVMMASTSGGYRIT